jgi:hypothetical protein
MSHGAVLAAAHAPAHIPADWPGWLVIGVIGLIVLRWLLKMLGIGG